jgi:hypothetical protein
MIQNFSNNLVEYSKTLRGFTTNTAIQHIAFKLMITQYFVFLLIKYFYGEVSYNHENWRKLLSQYLVR